MVSKFRCPPLQIIESSVGFASLTPAYSKSFQLAPSPYGLLELEPEQDIFNRLFFDTRDFTREANQSSFSLHLLERGHCESSCCSRLEGTPPMRRLVRSLVASIGRVAEALQLSKRARQLRKPLAGPRPGAWLPG
jgi:hypothetical protein